MRSCSNMPARTGETSREWRLFRSKDAGCPSQMQNRLQDCLGVSREAGRFHSSSRHSDLGVIVCFRRICARWDCSVERGVIRCEASRPPFTAFQLHDQQGLVAPFFLTSREIHQSLADFSLHRPTAPRPSCHMQQHLLAGGGGSSLAFAQNLVEQMKPLLVRA